MLSQSALQARGCSRHTSTNQNRMTLTLMPSSRLIGCNIPDRANLVLGSKRRTPLGVVAGCLTNLGYLFLLMHEGSVANSTACVKTGNMKMLVSRMSSELAKNVEQSHKF